jgi:hypothetical protein
MKTDCKNPIIDPTEVNPNRDLFYQACETADKQYQPKNFYKETPLENPTKIAEAHPAVRTITPEQHNRYENTKHKIKFTDEIYNKLVIQRHLSNLVQGLLESK